MQSQSKTYITIAIALLVLTTMELTVFSRTQLGFARTLCLLILMAVKALLVALFYMNLKKEPLSLKLAFFMLIPAAVFFLSFMMYDAVYIWHS